MSCNPRIVKIPLALAVVAALGSGSAAWAQTSSGFQLLLGELAPLDIAQSGTDANADPVFVRFVTSNRALKLTTNEAALCFDFTPAAEPTPINKLRFDLTLPSGSNEVLEGVSAAVISIGQDKLVLVEPNDELSCFAFPREELGQLEAEKAARASGSQERLFKSSFDLIEALPALVLEVRDPERENEDRVPWPTLAPQVGDTVRYTVRVSVQDRGAGGTLEDVRIRDYVPPVSVNGEALGLSQNVRLVRCTYGTDQWIPPDDTVAACSIDDNGFLRLDLFPGYPGNTLDLAVNAEVEFVLERTVVAASGSTGGSDVYVIAAASANPVQASLGSLDDAFHVFTFS